jgi:hypothetical protein
LYQLSEFQARAILSAPEDHLEDVTDAIIAIYEARHNLPSTSEIEAITDQWKKEATPETGPAQLPVQGRPLSEPGQQEKQPPDHEHIYDAGSTHCRICGRELTAPESVKAGIGPICAGGKPRSSPEEIYASIHDLYSRFENPNAIFVVRLLQAKHGLGHEGAYQALSDYKKNRLTQPPSLTPATTSTPETKVTEEPKQQVPETVTCPICGQLDTQQHINEAVSDFAEYLVTAGILPPKGAELVKEALTRIRHDQDLKLIAEKETAVESEEAEEEPDEGVSADEVEYEEEEQESLAAESEAQEEDEDREWEEHEREEAQSHESTDPEEEEQ